MCEILHTSVICGSALLNRVLWQLQEKFLTKHVVFTFSKKVKLFHFLRRINPRTIELCCATRKWLYKIHKGDRCLSGPVSLGGQHQQQLEQEEDRCSGRSTYDATMRWAGATYWYDATMLRLTKLRCYHTTVQHRMLRCTTNAWVLQQKGQKRQ